MESMSRRTSLKQQAVLASAAWPEGSYAKYDSSSCPTRSFA